MSRTLIKICGWYGLVALLLAFTLLTFGAIEAKSFLYLFLNITGAAGIASNAIFEKDWPAGILNLVWILIGCIGLIKLFH